MSGSSIGKIFKITTWGESHGKSLGVVIDGCPSGIELSEEDIQVMLDRRKPGKSRYTTKRSEDDKIEILSGVFEGKTTGMPIALALFNKDQRSKDYSQIKEYYRPGHADYTFDMKYGFRDYRGGGRSSGRETVARVAAGAIAKKILSQLGIDVIAYSKEIAGVAITPENFDLDVMNQNSLYMPDKVAYEQAVRVLEERMKETDSAGGVVECLIKGVKAGIGEPVFDKLDANLAKAIVSIGAVKGFEIGSGTLASTMKGSENNDAFCFDKDRKISKESNNAGGVLGGISDGSDIIFRAFMKPTPSIFKTQNTINKSGETIKINIDGRHDAIIVPRAVVVVESMAAIILLDLLLESLLSNINTIKKAYEN